MKRISHRYMVLTASLLACLLSAGCKDQSKNATRASAPSAKPTPTESFDFIVETFRRRIEGAPIGFVASDSGGRSMMTGRSTVTSQLISPATPGDKYKAVITVQSQASYSINRAKSGTDKDSSSDKDAKQDTTTAFSDTDEKGQIIDSDLVSQSGDSQGSTTSEPDTAKDVVAEHPTKRERKYELVYDNGRWTLITKLDPQTEQSIQNAFDQALKTQI